MSPQEIAGLPEHLRAIARNMERSSSYSLVMALQIGLAPGAMREAAKIIDDVRIALKAILPYTSIPLTPAGDSEEERAWDVLTDLMRPVEALTEVKS